MREPGIPEIFGLPLDVDASDLIARCTPLCGFVVIKALDDEGEVGYFTAATHGLKSVECLGMAEFAVLKLQHGLTSRMNDES